MTTPNELKALAEAEPHLGWNNFHKKSIPGSILVDTDTILALIALVEQQHEALVESVDLVQQEYDADWRHGIPTRKGQLKALREQLIAHKAALSAYEAFARGEV